MKKRLTAMILAALMVLALAACGKDTPAGESSVPESTATADSTTAPTEGESTAAPTDATTAAPTTAKPTDGTKKKPTTTTTANQSKITTSYTGRTVAKTGIHNVLKAYGGGILKKDEYLCAAAYMVNGQIKDTLFEYMICLNSPSNVTYFNHSKSDQQKWIKNYVLRNLDTLEEAVAEVKTALNKPDYKVKVFMTLYELRKSGDFGEVGGKNLDLAVEADRITAYKWFMDEYATQIAAKNYKNIQLIGYYWQEEYIDTKEMTTYQQITDYARSKGYISIISPFFGAPGVDRCNDAKFDLSSMQCNYFSGGSPNAGGFGRLASANLSAIIHNHGIEMELEGLKPEAVTIFKQYMQAGIQYDWIKNYQVWYISNGCPTLKTMATNHDAYIRSAYTEVYRYVKGKLKESDIVFQ